MFFLIFFIAMSIPLSGYWLFAQSVAACRACVAGDGFGFIRYTAATALDVL